jgi:hypothetical protein
MKRQLAKIYYQDREIQDIFIRYALRFGGDIGYHVSVGISSNIDGTQEVITLNYVEEGEKEGDKEYYLLQWEIKDPLDKIDIKHIDSGVMIKWLSGLKVKSSMFIPMERIQYIHVDNPDNEDEDHSERNEIPR